MFERLITDLSNLFGDDLVCIVTRSQRWSTLYSDASGVILVLTWDANYPTVSNNTGSILPQTQIRSARLTWLVISNSSKVCAWVFLHRFMLLLKPKFSMIPKIYF